RRRHTRCYRDWSSDVCSSDLVLTYLQNQNNAAPTKTAARLLPASPKARRLAVEQGKDLAAIQGTGPGGAVLAADVIAGVQRAQRSEERRVGKEWSMRRLRIAV